MFNTEIYMYTQFWHRYTNMETSADFRQPCFNKNFQTTNIKSNQNFPLHKYTGWLNLASHIWLNPLKLYQPPEIFDFLGFLQFVVLKLWATEHCLLCVWKAPSSMLPVWWVSQEQKEASDDTSAHLKPVSPFSSNPSPSSALCTG